MRSNTSGRMSKRKSGKEKKKKKRKWKGKGVGGQRGK